MKQKYFDYYPVLFIGILFLFYPELLTAKAGPLVSDHWEQHYPWAFYLSKMLKAGTWPLWTPHIQSGFPIAAESQIGIFYLPNLLLSWLLPIHMSYSYTMLLHFLFCGLACYFYARCMGLSRLACFFAASIFVFGTGYGGAYYNITSLKTISWLPFFFLCFEKYFSEKKAKWLIFLAFGIGMCLVAGYLQVAALTLFIFLMYAIFRFIHTQGKQLFTTGSLASISMLGLAGALGILIALPQILMTFQLAILSNRTGVEEGYAYVGSLSPIALSTIVFPYLQSLFRGNCLYQGIFSIFLVFLALTSKKHGHQKTFFKIWLFMMTLSLLFALGRWSPVYVGFVKLTHFYSFRTPAKFLIFFNLAFAFMAGLGVDLILEHFKADRLNVLRPNAKLFCQIMVVMLLGFLSLHFLLVYFRPQFEELGKWALHQFIYGQAGHAHSIDVYYQKLDNMLNYTLELLDPFNPWFLWAAALITLNGFLILVMVNYRKTFRLMLGLLFFLLMTDFYVFSLKDIRTDFATYESVELETVIGTTLRNLKKEGRINRLYIYKNVDDEVSILPSINMFYDIEDIGGYSPLILKRYHESIGLFGNVNDSNMSYFPEPEFIYQRLPLLKGLGVSHILSKYELHDERLKLLLYDEPSQQWLYELKGHTAKAFFVTSFSVFPNWTALKESLLTPGFNPLENLLLEASEIKDKAFPSLTNEKKTGRFTLTKSSVQHIRYDLTTVQPEFFVLMQSHFPAWAAYLDGAEIPIYKAYGLFQAFWIGTAGEHKLELVYKWDKALGIKS